MKKNSDNFKKIEKIFLNNFKIKKITMTTDLTKIKNWDSLKHLQLIMLLEKEFRIKFSIKENFNLKKICDFTKVIEK